VGGSERDFRHVDAGRVAADAVGPDEGVGVDNGLTSNPVLFFE
jgi:hypothetical protein